MAAHPFASKTLSFEDFDQPEIARVASRLRRFAFRLGLSGTAFAVNGILRRRFWVRPHKLWEYSRGVACVLAQRGQERTGAALPARVLDFGGGATLPIFYLADGGCEVLSLDIDEPLTEWTNRVGQRHGWNLRGSTFDLTQFRPPTAAPTSGESWGQFDAVISFSVLEHIRKAQQPIVVERLASLLKPGGVFVLTFDYGPDAPVEHAVRDAAEVKRLVATTGLSYLSSGPFTETGQYFVLDRRHPSRRFTFASLFLVKPH